MKLVAATLIVLGTAGTWWITQRILNTGYSSSIVSATSNAVSAIPISQDISPDALANTLSKTNLPVIGEGPLVRFIAVDDTTVRSVYGAASPRNLTADELVEVNGHSYALEQYGVTNGKRLVLTFDDGPDVKYTPELLNILSRAHVPATFFVVGKEVAKYPEIVRRMVREGHEIANHSFTHPDFEGIPDAVALQEINLTQRVLRASSGYETRFFRPPYVGSNDQGLRDSLKGIMDANRMGMTAAIYDVDTEDWEHPNNSKAIIMPPFDGKDHVLLLHDAGGKRDATLEYVERLVKEASQHGYQFVTFSGLYPKKASYFRPAEPSTEDDVFMIASQSVLVWPLQMLFVIFSITVIFVFIGMFLYLILAIIQKRRSRRRNTDLLSSQYQPAVAIIVPAYNEAKVLASCVKSLLTSDYKRLRVYIVDDGSKDGTYAIAKRLAKKYPRVSALHKRNGGKSSALNYAIGRTRSPIVIGIDADTHFRPDTVGRLVRHFEDPSVGAVAGLVKVGNLTNILARCQALEYASSIGLERSAQALLGGIMVVPGACGAWRREAIAQAGWYSASTLAEDCDLTVAMHVTGFRVVQDNTAVAYTEVPTTIRNFAKQRFRWTFGNIQVYRKYQNILFASRYGWLDSLVLPLAILSTLTPLLFLPLLVAVSVVNLLEGQYLLIILFSAVSFAFQIVKAWIGLMLGDEKKRYVWLVPVARLIYGPLRIYLIYGTFLRALRGLPVGWSKLSRVGMLMQPKPVQVQAKP